MAPTGYGLKSNAMHKVNIEQLKGVGQVRMDLSAHQRAYVFIGSNGSGKTKILEALFQCYLLSSSLLQKESGKLVFYPKSLVAKKVTCDNHTLDGQLLASSLGRQVSVQAAFNKHPATHNKPLVFVGAQRRGLIEPIDTRHKGVPLLGDNEQRRESYFTKLLSAMDKQFSSLGMSSDIETWFIQRATSANRYQAKKDERSVEIEAVLSLLNRLSPTVDASFLEVSGDGRVLLKIDGNKIQLDHLSSGYSSVLKIFQSIVAGYGAQTNETDLCHIPGIVFLDEIESHLHVEWQAKIIPVLKELFPNTLFYISTHSPLILAQLCEGEAYKVARNQGDGVVTANQIDAPNKSAFVDIIKEAFSIDINQLKRDGMSADEQKNAKKALLKLLDDE